MLYLDVEYQFTAEEMAGTTPEHMALRGVAVAVTYDPVTATFEGFGGQLELVVLCGKLRAADMVVGWHIADAGLPALKGHGFDLGNVHFLDLSQDLHQRTGEHWSLNNVTMATLKLPPMVVDDDLTTLYQADRLTACYALCQEHCLRLWLLHEYGRDNGIIYGTHDRVRRIAIPVNW